MLEAGMVRKKNSANSLIKNLADTCIGALTFYAIGFG
jgi:Amt family ammonium transporter